MKEKVKEIIHDPNNLKCGCDTCKCKDEYSEMQLECMRSLSKAKEKEAKKIADKKARKMAKKVRTNGK